MRHRKPDRRETRPGRRHSDRLRVAPTIGASLWLLLISGLVLIAILRINDQRRIAVSTTCAIVSGVSDAGQNLIVANALPETPFTRRLEALGYPKREARIVQAHAAATAYREQIAERVASTVGGRAHGVLRADGSINCHRLIQIATGGFP